MVSETAIPACPGNCDHGCARTNDVDVVVRWWAYFDNAWLEPWHPSRDLYHFHFRLFHVRLDCADTQYELDLGRSIADAQKGDHRLSALEGLFRIQCKRQVRRS